MPEPSAAEHDADSIRKVAKWLEQLVADLKATADEYADEKARVVVTRDDQRRRGILFLGNFRAAAQRALQEHREKGLTKTPAKPRKKRDKNAQAASK